MWMISKQITGVFVAAVTPLTIDDRPDVAAIPALLRFYAQRGCHGALLLGTTGEGPSFSLAERELIFAAAQAVRVEFPDFCLLAGTGTPSLSETIAISRSAFQAGFDGVVVLPPYYFRDATEEGLFTWFSRLIDGAVPDGRSLFGYHIPKVSGVPLSHNLLARLSSAFPVRFAGIKDSSGDPEHARQLGARFGKDLQVFTGNDRLFEVALENHAAGCITAPANIFSPELRRLWDAHAAGESDPSAIDRLDRGRTILDRYQPAAPILKALLSARFDFPSWPVRPPLLPFDEEGVTDAIEDLETAGLLSSAVK
jgi:4-hydroxy-tetrahydrodipicolinate synthase